MAKEVAIRYSLYYVTEFRIPKWKPEHQDYLRLQSVTSYLEVYDERL